MGSHRLLVISDIHFFDPHYFQYVLNGGRKVEPPSRLSTDIALGDRRMNPFQALLLLAREKTIRADSLVCCGDLTTGADPAAMNLGWLQLQRLAAALEVPEPLVTTGNHDLDSRFKISGTSPQRMLSYLDPPFPTSDPAANASYWANGYCIVNRPPSYRFILLNTCSLHGYQTEAERQHDHGFVPEEFLTSYNRKLCMSGI